MKYINHGVIWKNRDKNGNIYLAFKASRDIKEGESFNMFANDKGDNSSRPDFKAYDVIKEEEAPIDEPEVTSEEAEEVSNQIPF